MKKNQEHAIVQQTQPGSQTAQAPLSVHGVHEDSLTVLKEHRQLNRLMTGCYDRYKRNLFNKYDLKSFVSD